MGCGRISGRNITHLLFIQDPCFGFQVVTISCTSAGWNSIHCLRWRGTLPYHFKQFAAAWKKLLWNCKSLRSLNIWLKSGVPFIQKFLNTTENKTRQESSRDTQQLRENSQRNGKNGWRICTVVYFDHFECFCWQVCFFHAFYICQWFDSMCEHFAVFPRLWNGDTEKITSRRTKFSQQFIQKKKKNSWKITSMIPNSHRSLKQIITRVFRCETKIKKNKTKQKQKQTNKENKKKKKKRRFSQTHQPQSSGELLLVRVTTQTFEFIDGLCTKFWTILVACGKLTFVQISHTSGYFLLHKNSQILSVMFAFCSTSDCALTRPEFFKECVGFGCEVTRHNEHMEKCTADLTEKSLRKCAKKNYAHITFKRSGTGTSLLIPKKETPSKILSN